MSSHRRSVKTRLQADTEVSRMDICYRKRKPSNPLESYRGPGLSQYQAAQVVRAIQWIGKTALAATAPELIQWYTGPHIDM